MRNVLVTVCLAVLSGAACQVVGTGLDVQVVSATLTDHKAITLVIVGGATWGDAIMSFTDTAGVTREVPVAFAGPAGGLVMDVHIAREDLLFDNSTTAELQIPEGGVPVDDLFGLYDGSGGGAALGLGICGHNLDNDAGVRLVLSGACAGLALARSENWITMSTDGDVIDPVPAP
jgi:hypothetical protein